MTAVHPNCCLLISVTASAENVEKVVSPPRKPVAANNRTSGGRLATRVSKTMVTPMR